jgi:hypothetical protein
LPSTSAPHRCAKAAWKSASSISTGTAGSAGQVARLRSWCAGFGSTEGARAVQGRAACATFVLAQTTTRQKLSAVPAAPHRSSPNLGVIGLSRRRRTRFSVTACPCEQTRQRAIAASNKTAATARAVSAASRLPSICADTVAPS